MSQFVSSNTVFLLKLQIYAKKKTNQTQTGSMITMIKKYGAKSPGEQPQTS